jgi:hypothetical protein
MAILKMNYYILILVENVIVLSGTRALAPEGRAAAGRAGQKDDPQGRRAQTVPCGDTRPAGQGSESRPASSLVFLGPQGAGHAQPYDSTVLS